jgi:hypothetical protein
MNLPADRTSKHGGNAFDGLRRRSWLEHATAEHDKERAEQKGPSRAKVADEA